MKEIELIQKLDAAAGPPPEIDVADQVLRRIRTARAQAPQSGPMWIAALISSVAAAAVLLIALQSVSALQNPLGDLLTPMWTVLQ
jgi:anti-sigma factor RsiW